MAEDNSIEKYGDFDPSQWKFPEPEKDVEILPPGEEKTGIEKVLAAKKESQQSREAQYQKEVRERRNRVERMSPAEFVKSEVEAWRERHENSENIDTNSAFETFQALLAMLVEEGPSWPPQKKKMIRSIVIDLLKNSFDLMKPEEKKFLVALETNPNLEPLQDGDPLSQKESELVAQILKGIKGNGGQTPMLEA